MVAPLFLNLSSPELQDLVGENFYSDGRSTEVAVYRVQVPILQGYTATVVASTCGANTSFGTMLSAFDECPDPWAASSQANYKDRAIVVNDDDDQCDGIDALSPSDGYTSRASRIVADVGQGVTEVFVLVEKDSSDLSATASTASSDNTFTLSVTCGITTPSPTPLPTPTPTPVPTFEFVTAISLNATLRLEFADLYAFDGLSGQAAAVFASAFAGAFPYTRSDAVSLRSVKEAPLPCQLVEPTPAPSPSPTLQPRPLPTALPVPHPTGAPSSTPQPSGLPSQLPSPSPSQTLQPSYGPTLSPSRAPSPQPSSVPTIGTGGGARRRQLLTSTTTLSIACGETVSGSNVGLASYVGSASGDAVYQFTTTEPVCLSSRLICIQSLH